MPDRVGGNYAAPVNRALYSMLTNFKLYTMTENKIETKTRKSPVPQQYDRILAGAMKLPYAERAMIAQKLTEANKQEVAELQERLKAMNETPNGPKP